MRVKMVIEVSEEEMSQAKETLKECDCFETVEELFLERAYTDLYDYLDEVPKVEVI